MVLKRQYSFRWRIFLPIVLMMTCIIGLLMWYYYHSMSNYRRENIQNQLSLFNSRMLYCYDNDIDIGEFIKSLHNFFLDSRFGQVRVSVFRRADYDNGLPPLYYMGEPLDREFIESMSADYNADSGQLGHDSESTFYFRSAKSRDGNLLVFTAMPMTQSISRTLNVADITFWLVFIALTAAAIVFTWLATNSIAKNIRMLKEFAREADDSTVHFDESQFPHNELGDISRLIVNLYRERGEALEKFRREHEIAFHAVEEKSRLKRQLTNNINHELKTPVGVIKGYLDTVLSSDDMDDKTRTYFLSRAKDNVDRLCNLLSDVSTMTRLEDGSGNIPVTAIDMHDIVYTIENDFITSGQNNGMTFEFDIPLDCEVLGNANLLVSVITNLIRNSVVHSHGTAMGLRLVAESDKYYTFAFWDNGAGVDETHIPHLFDRFYRVDAGRSRKSGGTGLGLPIVKNIIDALGGSISVHNRIQAEGGLEFMFTLKKWGV